MMKKFCDFCELENQLTTNKFRDTDLDICPVCVGALNCFTSALKITANDTDKITYTDDNLKLMNETCN